MYIVFRLKFDTPRSDADGGSPGPSSRKVGLDFYDGDPELPVFSRIKHGCPVEILVKTLLSYDEKQACKVQPLGVQANVAFVIDLDSVVFKDIKADDLGTWRATGTKRVHFRFTQCNAIRYANGIPSKASNYFLLTRRYYVHGTYQRYHRIISDIKGKLN